MDRTDVVIPACEAGDSIARAVMSCVRVPGLGRIHVVDDGSQRPLADDADRLRAELGPLADRLVLHRRARGGPGPARNLGVASVLEDPGVGRVVFLDADDELTAGIADAVGLLDRLGAAAVCANSVFVYEDGRERVLDLPAGFADRALPRPGAMFGLHTPVFRGTGLVVARRVLDAGLRFDARLWNSQDVDFVRRSGDVGPIAACSAVGLRYRRRYAGNQTGENRLDVIVACHLLLMERHFEAPEERVWRERAEHLLRRAAKRWHDPEVYRSIAEAMRARGWPLPLRARRRHAAAILAGPFGGYAKRARGWAATDGPAESAALRAAWAAAVAEQEAESRAAPAPVVTHPAPCDTHAPDIVVRPSATLAASWKSRSRSPS